MYDREREIELESVVTLQQAIGYVEKFLDGLRNGRLRLDHEGQSLQLAPQQSVRLELGARKKADKESISIKLAWRKEARPAESPALQISSGEAAQPGHPGQNPQ